MTDRPTVADSLRQLGAGLFFLAGAGSYVFIVVLTAQKHGLHADNARVLGVVYAPLVFGQLVFAFRYLHRFQVALARYSAWRMQSEQPGVMYRPLVSSRYVTPVVYVVRMLVACAFVAGFYAWKVHGYAIWIQPWAYALVPMQFFCEVYLSELQSGRTERRFRMRAGTGKPEPVQHADLARGISGGVLGFSFQLPVLALLVETPPEMFVVPMFLSIWCTGVVISYWAWLNLADWLLARKLQKIPLPG